MNVEELIEQLVEKIGNATQATLWDAADIGRYLKLAKSTVQSHVICKVDFPKAIKVNGGRRWHPDEVKAWALSNREAA